MVALKPYLQDADFTLWNGDALETLRELPAESVHCCLTSPPFFGLRDYGTGTWEGGDAGCDHTAAPTAEHAENRKRAKRYKDEGRSTGQHGGWEGRAFRSDGGSVCKCGARRVDRQIGLEQTPEDWVASLVAVFDEVKRVLRKDGTLWVECGDSYAGSWGAQSREGSNERVDGELRGDGRVSRDGADSLSANQIRAHPKKTRTGSIPAGSQLKPKDLIGQPFLLAFALREAGWVWRNTCIWAKPNPMPESVRDRFTVSHSYVLLFSKAKWSGPERTRLDDLSESDKRWLAAMIDTEGSVMVRRSRTKSRADHQSFNDSFSAQVAFVNTNQDLLAELQRISGADWCVQERKAIEGRATCWQMTLTNRKAADLLRALYPYLIAKRRQARLAIYAQTRVHYRGKRKTENKRRTPDEQALLERCWQASKDCNQGGDPDLSWVPEPSYGKWSPQPYFFDAEAVREPHQDVLGIERMTETNRGQSRVDYDPKTQAWNGGGMKMGARQYHHAGRNARSVWTIATEPLPFEHYAAFPQALAERCIKAGTSERGCCPECGAALVRETETEFTKLATRRPTRKAIQEGADMADINSRDVMGFNTVTTTGWRPSCECGMLSGDGYRSAGDANSSAERSRAVSASGSAAVQRNHTPAFPESIPCTVLDPFMGSGTTALTARRLGRHAIGIELNEKYCHLAAERTKQLSLLGEDLTPTGAAEAS